MVSNLHMGTRTEIAGITQPRVQTRCTVNRSMAKLLLAACCAVVALLQLPGALAEDSGYIENRQCFGCHKSQKQTYLDSIHGRAFSSDEKMGCQSCHGGGAAHKEVAGQDNYTGPMKIESFKKSGSISEEKNRPCLICHENKTHAKWRGSQHDIGGVACTECHSLHKASDTVREDVCYNCHKERRAQASRASHMPVKEGKMSCTSCHNPHGSSGSKLLNMNTVTETCNQCHAEKRGPFLWEHAPVSDDCTICHNPHGSVNAALLKSKPPFLCASCHIAGGHSTTGIRSGYDLGFAVVPGGNAGGAASQMIEKSCLSCHSMIHGSNHPSGARFVR